jgi:hypothetical protein
MDSNEENDDLKFAINGIVASLVIDFLKDSEHHDIASELLKLQNQTNLPELHRLKLSDLFSYVQNTEIVSEQESDYRTFGTTIREVFSYLIPVIDALGESEVKKTLKYILKFNAKVRKIHKETGHFTSHRDVIIKKKCPDLSVRPFTLITHGPQSEEAQIRVTWHALIENVPIIDPLKLLTDLEDCFAKTRTGLVRQLPNVLGCHLSSQLDTVRTAKQVFLFTFKTILPYATGRFDPVEDETIKEYLEKNGINNESFYHLGKILNRRPSTIKKHVELLTDDNLVGKNSAGARFNLKEDTVILEHLFKIKGAITHANIDSIKRKDFKDLSVELERAHEGVHRHWTASLKPLLISYFCGAFYTSWQLELAKYLIDKKVFALQAVNYEEVQRKWPWVTKSSLANFVRSGPRDLSQQGVPLYVRLQSIKYTLGSRLSNIDVTLRKESIIRIFNDLQK